MQPQIGLQFLIEGPGGFNQANVIVNESEGKRIIKDWSSGGQRTGVLRGENNSWAILMDSVRFICMFSLTQIAATGQQQGRPSVPFPPFTSGN